MSEEEIIKEFKNLIYNSDFDYIELMDEDGFTGWHELFENILDLYNKEKEKNKELENADLTTVYMNGFYDGEKKWKDKIREIFDNYSQSSLMENNTFLEFKKELLEERN